MVEFCLAGFFAFFFFLLEDDKRALGHMGDVGE